jgi:hypothetical protein
MVRAIMEGRKTQTRRIMKHQVGPDLAFQNCPHGAPGDRLWVKETHLPTARGVYYRADFTPFDAAGHGAMYGGWKPSIFCRREYSRISLEIVSVRVEKLQDISEEDAVAEGVEWNPGMYSWQRLFRHYGAGCNVGYLKPSESYRTLWQSINGPGSWESNPWVWVLEYKLLVNRKS